MVAKAATATSSDPDKVTVEELASVPYATFEVIVSVMASPEVPNAEVKVNGAPVIANANEVKLLNLQLRAIGVGDALVTAGPSPTSGTNLTVLGWAKGLLRLQLLLGAGLIVAGGLLALFGSRQSSGDRYLRTLSDVKHHCQLYHAIRKPADNNDHTGTRRAWQQQWNLGFLLLHHHHHHRGWTHHPD